MNHFINSEQRAIWGLNWELPLELRVAVSLGYVSLIIPWGIGSLSLFFLRGLSVFSFSPPPAYSPYSTVWLRLPLVIQQPFYLCISLLQSTRNCRHFDSWAKLAWTVNTTTGHSDFPRLSYLFPSEGMDNESTRRTTEQWTVSPPLLKWAWGSQQSIAAQGYMWKPQVWHFAAVRVFVFLWPMPRGVRSSTCLVLQSSPFDGLPEAFLPYKGLLIQHSQLWSLFNHSVKPSSLQTTSSQVNGHLASLVNVALHKFIPHSVDEH